MQTIKKKFYFMTWAVTFFFSNLATVFGGSDPFETATDKADELTEYLSGDFAVALCTVVIVVAAIALMMNKLRMEWALRIIGGAIIVGSAAKVAEWAFA